MDLHSGCSWKGQCRLFHFLWKAGYNRAILLSMLHTEEALAGFHVVQSSASLLSADGVSIVFQMQHTHIWVQKMIQSCLSSEVKMSLPFLQNLVLLKAPSRSILFFLSPTFLVQICVYMWATSLVPGLKTGGYPSQQTQLQSSLPIITCSLWVCLQSKGSPPGWSESPKQCPKLQLSFGVGSYWPCAAWGLISIQPQKGASYQVWSSCDLLMGQNSKWPISSGLAGLKHQFKSSDHDGSWSFFFFFFHIQSDNC